MQRSFGLTAVGLAAAVVSAAALVATGQQAERQQDRSQRAEQQQQDGERAGQRQQGQAGQSAECNLSEHHIAACLIIENQGEIELATFAGEQSQNEEVKQLAQKLIEDHTEYVSQLQQFAGPLGAKITARSEVRGQSEEGDENPRQDREEQDGERQQQGERSRTERQAADRPTGERQAADSSQGKGVELIQFKQEVGEKCLESTKEMLGEKQGADFDKAFVAQQCMAHMQMIDVLEVSAQHASPEFKEVLMAGRKTAQQHLEHCKTLHKQLEGQSRSARTEEPEENRPE